MAPCGRDCFLILLVVSYSFCNGDRIREKIYQEMKGIGTCFRRLNATHEIGCASERGGNVGIVHYVKGKSDVKWLREQGIHEPYVALVNSKDFDTKLVDELSRTGKINGLIVLDGNHTAQQFSPDNSCPNDRFGLYHSSEKYSNCQKNSWNPLGNDMLFRRFDFPVFVMVKQDEIDYIINKCYEKFNKPTASGRSRDYPLCAAELKDIMDAAKDAITCHRRTEHVANLNPDRFCDPLGDQNVFTTMKLMNKTVPRQEKSVIMATTRLDTTSLFENLYPGAESTVTGVVTLLAAAEALAKVKDDLTETDKDIMFTFFQGEAYGYIGSSRMVYDMQNGKFPTEKFEDDVNAVSNFNTSHISHFIEVVQLGLPKNNTFWLHTDPLSQGKKQKSETDKISQFLTEAGNEVGLNITQVTGGQPLPPASFQSFLKKDGNISGIVMTDHEKKFRNQYYNSRFDENKTINIAYPAGLNDTEKYDYMTEPAKKLTVVATALAKALYTLATGRNASNVTANDETVNHLLYCFMYLPTCELFRTVIDVTNAKILEKYKSPLPLYVSVDSTKNAATKFTRHLLAYYTGEVVVNATKDSCKQPEKDQTYDYIWMQGPEVIKEGKKSREPVCIKTLSTFSDAVSPAFDIKNYDWMSGEYSTWMESIWPADAMSVRIFLLPSQQQQTVILAVGVILFLVSMLLVYFINARADILFGKGRTPSYTS